MVAVLMKIELDTVGKRYRSEWILRNINLSFEAGKSYAVTGPNGSGKSTLLKMLSGHLTPSKGKLRFSQDGKSLEVDQVFQYLSYSAPYIDLIEDFTLWEALKFHYQFKPLMPGTTLESLYQRLNFKKARNKLVRDFSSGMKQRLKLLLAICSDTPLLLLDEPTTNLDQEGMQWYRQLIDEFTNERLLIIASNVDVDFDFCEERVDILAYKKK
jgi:ABC-2 type transport system ATP-binding protein